MRIINTKRCEIVSFNWIFAFFAGAVILFLAVFFAGRYTSMERYKYDSEVAAKLAILLNPLETSLAGSAVTRIELPAQTRLKLECRYIGLGSERLSISTRSNVGQQWQEYGAATEIGNKYIFSQGLEEGKTLYIFSKQMNMPFGIGDLIFTTTRRYCLVNPPEDIESEIRALNASNMLAVTRKQECPQDAISVCFGTSSCSINVHPQCLGYGCKDPYSYGLVEHAITDTKNEIVYYYGDALMYGAIFSSKGIYECNVQRLLKRISMLSQLYNEKALLLDARGCSTPKLRGKLSELNILSSSLISNANILGIVDKSQEVEAANDELVCRPF